MASCALCMTSNGVTTNLGQSMELSVIAAAVIGGANLLGGNGTILGPVVGAALIEIIRNSLTLLGISAFWQGAFVGTFTVVAVAFDSVRNGRRNPAGQPRRAAVRGPMSTCPRSGSACPKVWAAHGVRGLEPPVRSRDGRQ